MSQPYYDSPKIRLFSQRQSYILIFIIVIMLVAGFFIGKALRWENANMVPIWVEYEVKILDKDKVVFYKSHDVSDSLVFRCRSDIFLGTQVIEKLEYRLP